MKAIAVKPPHKNDVPLRATHQLVMLSEAKHLTPRKKKDSSLRYAPFRMTHESNGMFYQAGRCI
ncbi:MAG: hypothetical protein HY800_07225 [Ignavibacteriales bacterium]|nr:hypothetical protein [Ignavibacteriales bacterium]